MIKTAKEIERTKCCIKKEKLQRNMKHSKELTEFLYGEYEALGLRLGA